MDERRDDRATASTGIEELDRALERLCFGDNVVWESENHLHEPFYAAAAGVASDYDYAAFVTVTASPDDLRRRYPTLEVIDARPGQALERPGALLSAIRGACAGVAHPLLLFDSLDAMGDRWGNEIATRFFVRTCPMLLDLGAVAYWSLTTGSYPTSMRREVAEITQCVIALTEGRLRIVKAEARSQHVQGSVYRLHIANGPPTLSPAPTAARLGEALRALRARRGLSQGDLARLAGVSASAISQAERGTRGLSLETLLELTAQLGITLDELLRGELAPGYRLARPLQRSAAREGKPIPLFDDPLAGIRAYVVHLAPRGTSPPHGTHKGAELVAVGSGLVQVVLGTARPVLRRGDALLIDRSTIQEFRNLGDAEAMLFWILRDESGPEAPRDS